VRGLSAVAVYFVIVLGAAWPALAGVSVGVNEDVYFEASSASFFFATMKSEGLQVDTVTLRWDETAPTTIPTEQAKSASTAIANADAAGITVVLNLYPLHSQALTRGVACRRSADPTACGDSARIQQFAAWAARVAQAFPSVHQFIVMNECNQPLFINPQWDSSGQNQSATICGRALAAAYDTLHAESGLNFVWGVGLSPRGGDNPRALNNSSTSPVKFLGYLGAWFKAFAQKTGRRARLMDGLDFHPYLIPQSLPFAQGYAQTNYASISNLPRIYQAFYNGFNGTGQPTIGQQVGGGLPVSLNEAGIQTDSTGKPGYSGSETSATAGGGVIGRFATEDYQASWYQQMLDLVACDPNVRIVNVFHLVDEESLAGWQSGLYYRAAIGSPTGKASAQTVRDWITRTGGNCQGATRPWRPGAPSLFSTARTLSERASIHHVIHTFARYHNASGPGPNIAPGQTVRVSCKVRDPAIKSVNPDGYWYRIASAPWNNGYYAPANTFLNGDPPNGPYSHDTDFAVPNCAASAAAPPQPALTPRVTLTKGAAATIGYDYDVTLSAFAPNAKVTISCRDTVSPRGFHTFSTKTNGSGQSHVENQCHSAAGPEHWIVANGRYESNHVTWGLATPVPAPVPLPAPPAQPAPTAQPPPPAAAAPDDPQP
jgi:hypothetical protein